jgi:hypothetical protein
MKQKNRLFLDLVIIIGIIGLSLIPILLFNLKFFAVAILLFGLPSAYLLISKPRPIRRILTASIFGGIIFSFIFDFLAVLNNAWGWDSAQFVFPYKILGIVSLDEIIWLFLWVSFIVIFYEHFLEHARKDRICHNFKFSAAPLLLVLAAVIIMQAFYPELLVFGYAYFALCIVTLPFLIYTGIKRPMLLGKFFKAAIFFIPLYLIVEAIALSHGQWFFHGQYIGQVQLGSFMFPFEELFFWILLSSTIVLSYYEIFIGGDTK